MDNRHSQGKFWANLGLLQSKKNSDCNQSVFFFEKRPFYNKKEQNISNESSGVIGPIGFRNSPKLMHLVFLLKNL